MAPKTKPRVTVRPPPPAAAEVARFVEEGAPPRRTPGPPATPRPPPTKAKATFHLPVDLVAEARAAVFALAGPPERLTLAGLVERALRAELDRLERKHNRGEPFAAPDAPLRTGRPMRR
jgi:hypothetical protein